MEENSWWKPKNLRETEKAFQGNISLDKININNDFGSYKVMLETNDLDRSKISLHNDIKPKYKIQNIKKFVNIPSKYKKIYDIGCGLGFTTNQLSKFYPKYEVIGVDISNDAVEYGKNNFKGCKFLARAVDPSDKEQKFNADMICAFEFYPFTRTDDLATHVGYISHLTNGLSINGKLILFQKWNNPKSLSKNCKTLKTKFPNLKFDDYSIPPKEIYNIFRSILLSNIISTVVRNVLMFTIKKQIGLQKMLVITRIK